MKKKLYHKYEKEQICDNRVVARIYRGKYYIHDNIGNTINRVGFTSYSIINPSRLKIKSGGKWYLINQHGNKIIPESFILINSLDCDKVSVCNGNAWRIMDLNGNIIKE